MRRTTFIAGAVAGILVLGSSLVATPAVAQAPVVTASQQAPVIAAAASKYKVYTEKTYRFSFSLPRTWSVKKTSVASPPERPQITLTVRDAHKHTQLVFQLFESGVGDCISDSTSKQPFYAFGVTSVAKRLKQNSTTKEGFFFMPAAKVTSFGSTYAVPASSWMGISQTIKLPNGSWHKTLNSCALGGGFTPIPRGLLATTVPATAKITTLTAAKKFTKTARYAAISRVLRSVTAAH